MTKDERVRYDMFIRVGQFITDNSADFPAGSVVAVQAGLLQNVVDNVQTLIGEQSAGLSEARFDFNSKDTARENLRAMLSDISETARSMTYAMPGIDLKFRMSRNRNDAELLAKAQAFLKEAAPIKTEFVEYGLDSNFTVELQTLIDNFENSFSAPGAAIDQHVAATAETGAEIRQGMIAVRTMEGVVKNKYRTNVGKLAAWLSASHIEKVAVEKKPLNP